MLVTDTPDPQASAATNQQLQLRVAHFVPINQIQSCSSKQAIDFLIDNSGSMLEPGAVSTNPASYYEEPNSKIAILKQALLSLSSSFTDSTIVGVQVFSGPSTQVVTSLGIAAAIPKIIVPIDTYKNNSAIFQSSIATMHAAGSTYTKEGFTFAQSRIEAAMQQFPGYKFSLIFISDGIPETIPASGSPCTTAPNGQQRCFAQIQDPTSVATTLKTEGVHIYTIRYLDTDDTLFNTNLQTMMDTVVAPFRFITSAK